MSQALYRKYRSRALGEIIGQEHITDTLGRALKAGRISHAYLFTGPRGTGKTSVARILAYAINELPYADTTHLDIIEIDAASNRRIDDIRDLREKVHIAPVSAKYKVYIIDEVHMLTNESFNALLKTLEEPPAHVVFILATTEAHKLPATIISRAQRFAFRAASTEKVVALLKDIASKEKIDIHDEALELIAEHGNGSFRDSVSLLDQMVHVVSGQVTTNSVQQALGLASRKSLASIVDSLIQGDHQAVATGIAELESRGSSPSALTQQLIQVITNLASADPVLYELIDQLLDVPRAYSPSLKLLSTLMVFATKQQDAPEKAKQPPRRAAATHASSAPALSITAKKPAKVEPALVEDSEPGEQTNSEQLDELTPEQWTTVLLAVKKANAPLFSVVRQGQPSFDSDKKQLTLSFKYQLHRKKMDDPKVKAALVSILHSALGKSTSITTNLDADVKPAALPDDPTVASVAAIMGGGEVVNAEKV